LGTLLILHRELPEEAELAFRNAIRLDPKGKSAYQALEFVLQHLGRTRDVLALSTEWQKNCPQDIVCFLAMARAYKVLGQAERSRTCVAKARELMPKNAPNLYNRACVESILGNVDAAIRHLSRATPKKDYDPAWAWKDPDLQWIRDDPRFAEIVGPRPAKGKKEKS
jgi:tetratricopeptide (TPR) repeat protein